MSRDTGMPKQRRVTREAIVKEAVKIIGRKGTSAVTFQAIASAFGVSKQAIIYWYPTKWALVADVCLPFMREEAAALLPALARAAGASEAKELLIRAFVAHYMPRLPQFRMLYLPTPLGESEPNAPDQQAALAPVHAVTASVYSALEDKIRADASSLTAPVSARRAAVAVHMAAVGLVTMFAAADAIGDPMVHAPDDMVEALIAILAPRQASETSQTMPA
jgi:AcrR family transcriptional regulator